MSIKQNLSWTYGCRSDVGRRREHNEDSFAVLNRTALDGTFDGLFIVADGMGGMGGGDVASRMVAQSLPETLRHSLPVHRNGRLNAAGLLHDAIVHVNREVYAQRSRHTELSKMGTTCLAALVSDSELTLANVGDSRAYLLQRGRLLQLTADHSRVWEEVQAGQMTREEAQHSRYRNVITRAVGIAPEVEPDIFSHRLEQGDTVLLCSDGLTVEVADAEVARILAATADPQEACDRLVETALRHGGSDNITVVVLRYGQFVPISLSDEDEEDTDPNAEWRGALREDEDAGREETPSDLDEMIPRHEAKAALTRVKAVAYLFLALALAEAVGIGMLWKEAHKPLPAPPPAPKPVPPPTAGPLGYDARPTKVITAPLRDDILVAAPDGNLLVATQQGLLLPLTPQGKELPLDNNELAMPGVQPAARRANRSITRTPPVAKADVTLDVSGNRYQIDPVTRSISKYSPDGVLIRSGIGKGLLRAPARIAVSPATGDIYIIDSGRLLRFSAHSNTESPAATDLTK